MSSPSLKSAPKVADWLEMTPGGELLVHTGKVDIGQRITAALATVAAEELNFPLERVRVLAASTAHAPDEGYTAGSNSIVHSAMAVRAACATARGTLLAAAAKRMRADASNLTLDDGLVRDRGTNVTLALETLWPDLAPELEVDPQAASKAPEHFRLVGTSLAEPANPSGPTSARLISGKAPFIHDLQFEGMLHARVIRPPNYHSRLEALSHESLPPGVTLVRDGSFIALAGADEYQVIRLTQAVAAATRWTAAEMYPGEADGDIFTALRANPRTSLPVIDGTPEAREVPPAPPDPPDTAEVFEATYERPYQMHGSIGPSAAVAIANADTLHVWTHSQGIFQLKGALAEVPGFETRHITVEHVPGAGCYGHNGADDVALDAALVAEAIPGRHILLKWTRDDEHAWEPYGSCMAVRMRAGVSARTEILAWRHESFSDTHINRPRPGQPGGGTGGARLLAARHRAQPLEPAPAAPRMMYHGGIHRNAEPLYRFADTQVVKHLVRDLPLRTSSMRTLGAVANVFAIESFLDEIASACAADPVELRIAHLEDCRAIAVLESLRETMVRWRDDQPMGSGHGIGFAQYKNTLAYAAVGMELSVGDDASVKLHRAAIAADCGQVIDPDTTAAQLEGGLLQAASWALHEAVTFDRDGITSRDWDSYPILRFDEVPEIEVRLVGSATSPPLGVGEASSGPAVAAIANAIHAATGLRLRRMPFTPDAIRQAAMQ